MQKVFSGTDLTSARQLVQGGDRPSVALVENVSSPGRKEAGEPFAVGRGDPASHHFHRAVHQPVLFAEGLVKDSDCRGKPAFGETPPELPSPPELRDLALEHPESRF